MTHCFSQTGECPQTAGPVEGSSEDPIRGSEEKGRFRDGSVSHSATCWLMTDRLSYCSPKEPVSGLQAGLRGKLYTVANLGFFFFNLRGFQVKKGSSVHFLLMATFLSFS